MKTILVTGCAGLIGAQVTQQLCCDPAYYVVGIDNLNDYYDPSLKQHRLDQLANYDSFEFHRLDIEDAPGLQRLFDRNPFTAVINLAARAGVRYSLRFPHVYETTNSLGNLNLLELSREYQVPKFVLASTSSLYAGQPAPFHEDLPVNTPISPYAASKRAAEMMCHTYHHLYGIDVSILRYFTVYGPAGRPDMAYFRFIQAIDQGRPIQIYGDGNQSRDFTFVEDIARGTIAALRKVGCETINLGGGRTPTTLNEMIGRIETLLNRRAIVEYQPMHAADMVTTHADASKANRILDWRAQVELAEGLSRCVTWYLEHHDWASQIPLDCGPPPHRAAENDPGHPLTLFNPRAA